MNFSRYVLNQTSLHDLLNQHSYFNKFEKYVHDPEHPQVDTTVKGTEGPVRVGYFSTVSRASKDFVQACIKLGIPFSPDFNTSNGTRGVNRVSTVISPNLMIVPD